MKIIIDYKDLQYVVFYKQQNDDNEVYIDFAAYKIIGTDLEDKKIKFQKKDSTSSTDFVDKIEDAQVSISGWVKWNDWSYCSFDDEGIHFCFREEIVRFGTLMQTIFDECSQMIKKIELR